MVGENIIRQRVIYPLSYFTWQHQPSGVMQDLLSTDVQMDKPSCCKGVIREPV